MAVSKLYLSETMVDVHFALTEPTTKDAVHIPAHTQVICVESEVLLAMFYGHFKKEQLVEVSDAEPEHFKIFLKYLYFGNVELTDNNVFPTLYLAKKYLVDGLISACTDHMHQIIPQSDNATRLISEAQRCGELDKFLAVLDGHGETVLNADDFMLLERPLLRELLQRDTLHVSELLVYERLKKWAEHQTQEGRRKTHVKRPITDAQIREFLGDDLWLVRFASMTAAEFAEGPAQDACLTDKEKLIMFKYISCVNLRNELVKNLPQLNTAQRIALLQETPSLTADPPTLKLPPVGGTIQLRLTNPSRTRLAFKLKCTDTDQFRLSPVFGFVEPGASTPAEIVREEDGYEQGHWVSARYAEAASDAADPEESFTDGPVLGKTVIPIYAVSF